MLQEMNIKELETVDGGGTLKDIYTDIRDFINNNLGDLQVPENKANNNRNKYITNFQKMKESLPPSEIKPKKNEEKETYNQQIKNSILSLGKLKIPCFEYKQDINKEKKSAEYYLNKFYQKKNNSFSTNIKYSGSNFMRKGEKYLLNKYGRTSFYI